MGHCLARLAQPLRNCPAAGLGTGLSELGRPCPVIEMHGLREVIWLCKITCCGGGGKNDSRICPGSSLFRGRKATGAQAQTGSCFPEITSGGSGQQPPSQSTGFGVSG